MKERIKALRKKLGLNQTEFGKETKTSLSAVQKWESGENVPSNATIEIIRARWNVSEVWLRTGEGEMFAHKSREAEFSAACGEILRNCPDEDTLAVLTRVISALAKVDWSGVGLVQKRVDEIKKGE